MRPLHGPSTLLFVLLTVKTTFAYVEALAANVDSKDVNVNPALAFMCNRPTMYRGVNGWEADFEQDCIIGADEILSYCKKRYSNHDITNVVVSDKEVLIPDWPISKNEPTRKLDHKVKIWECIVGEFESKALLVPQHCIFDHKHSDDCQEPGPWDGIAEKDCKQRGMKMEHRGMLVQCGIDKFRGIEFVCCPEDQKEKPTTTGPKPSVTLDVDNDYMAYLRGDAKLLSKYRNEHQKFKAAEKSMQKIHHEKITKMMKEWQDAREQVASMRKSDYNAAEKLNTDITEKFQKLYHAYEQENAAEKGQLVALHQQHIQGLLNKRKRESMKQFMDELQRDEPENQVVLKSLRMYVRAEEKDLMHSVNHFEHVRDTDPKNAIQIREQTREHLRLIKERLAQAMNMLHQYPEIENKVKPEIEKFRGKFHSIETSADNVLDRPVTAEEEREMIEKYKEAVKNEDHDEMDMYHDSEEKSHSVEVSNESYQNIHIDSDGSQVTNDVKKAGYVAHQNYDAHSAQQSHFQNGVQTAASNGTGSVVGIAIGSVAVFVIIVVAVVMLRKRSRRTPITHGFVEVDPAASPEERHVTNMQINGYENPTYRYFDMNGK